MRNKKLERTLYGPTLLEITFGLLLSVLLGAVLAILFLVLKPVVEVAELPKADERKQGQVYYVPGTTDYAKAKQWMRKRQLLVESIPGEVNFTQDDLNAWSTSGQPQAAPAAKPGEAPPPPAEVINPSVLNFRLKDGALQVALPTTVNLLGFAFPIVSQARGSFQKQGDLFMYVPDQVMIGSLPLHRFPGMIDSLVKEVYADGRLPEALLTAWRHATQVVVDGDTLRVTLQ